MTLTTKNSEHNLKLIRRFEEDIWGVLALKNKPSSVLNYIYEVYQNNFKYRKLLKRSSRAFFLVRRKAKFLYKIVTDEKEFKRKKRTLKITNYLNLLKLRRFYGNLGEKKFRRAFKNLALSTNVVNRSFAYFLESRLDVILYRSNIFPSIFAARQYIAHKKVYVNGALVTKPGFRLKVMDVVVLSNPKLLYQQFKYRLKNNLILGNYPRYLEVNYKIGSIVFAQFPTTKDVPYPFFMDISTLANSFAK